MNTIRSTPNGKVVVLREGTPQTFDKDSFFPKNNFFQIIRIRQEDYSQIASLSVYTHFNLQWTSHTVGKIYALPCIIKPGFFSEKTEILPILSFENCPLAECVEVQNNVPYSDMANFDFSYSLSSIQNVNQLKEAILKRYTKSMPSLSKDKILSMGVAITKLNIIGKIEKVVY